MGSARFTWGDLFAVIRQSSRDTALFRSVNPETHEWGLLELLVAEGTDAARVANWQRGNGKKSDYPKPIPRPGVKQPETHTYGKGAIPIDEMAEWLGWDT